MAVIAASPSSSQSSVSVIRSGLHTPIVPDPHTDDVINPRHLNAVDLASMQDAWEITVLKLHVDLENNGGQL